MVSPVMLLCMLEIVKEAALVGESNKSLMEKRSNQLFSMTSLIGIA